MLLLSLLSAKGLILVLLSYFLFNLTYLTLISLINFIVIMILLSSLAFPNTITISLSFRSKISLIIQPLTKLIRKPIDWCVISLLILLFLILLCPIDILF